MPYDAIVVGGGFAGLSAALYLARARRAVLVIDSGKPRNRFADKSYGLLGHDGHTPESIIAAAREQLVSYPSVTFVQGSATRASRESGGFTVQLESGEAFSAPRIVLATGVIDELPDLPGLKERWGKTVAHCPYCHGYEFGGAALGVFATAASCVSLAVLLADWGPVTFFTNGALELDAEAHARLAKRGVVIETAKVAGLEGAAPELTGIRLHDGRVVPAAGLFVSFRIRVASPLAEQLGCEFEDTPAGKIIKTGPDKETSVAGVYAAGDTARHPHGVPWAVADGGSAGIALHQASVDERASS